MKVLQINSVCGIGSTGRIATDLHEILTEQGHESWIAFGRGEAKNCENTIKIGTNIDNYKHVAKTRILDRHGFGSKRATQAFIERVKRLNPDVIHLHNIHGYYINIEVLFEYLKESNKPVIWTLHDCWPFTGHCSYFDYVDCNKWEVACEICPQTKKYPASIAIDNSKSNYIKKRMLFTGLINMTIVTPSQWLANLVSKSFLSEYPVVVINNGIDLKAFKPITSDFRKQKKIEDKFMILGVASAWEKRKGYEFFFKLSEEISENEVLVMVGLSLKQIKDLPENIIGITNTESVQELAEIYSSADVFINPTFEDNFPTTNLESLACGTPVVTFNTGGSVESIDTKCGYIVDKGSLKDLLKAIKSVKSKGKKDFTNYCIEKSNNYYKKEDRFKDYIIMYKRIIG